MTSVKTREPFQSKIDLAVILQSSWPGLCAAMVPGAALTLCVLLSLSTAGKAAHDVDATGAGMDELSSSGSFAADGRCDRCLRVTRSLFGVGSLRTCHKKCSSTAPGGGQVAGCNLLCNLVVYGGCGKYGLNCAAGVCRAAGRCSRSEQSQALVSLGDMEHMGKTDVAAPPAAAPEIEANATLEDMSSVASDFWPNGPACEQCQQTTGNLLGVGSLAGYYKRYSDVAPGNGRVIGCNVLCNKVVQGGCSKYGLNCARGICQAAGRC